MKFPDWVYIFAKNSVKQPRNYNDYFHEILFCNMHISRRVFSDLTKKAMLNEKKNFLFGHNFKVIPLFSRNFSQNPYDSSILCDI